MPTYEYTCRDCGHTFEIVQSMNDEPLAICPECGGELRKVFAAPAIAFKGSGFYATDHGRKSKKSAEAKPSEKTGEKAGQKAGEKAGEKPGDRKDTKDAPKPAEAKASSSSSSGDGKAAS
jgi:putative FmdB family regulatory protein